MQEMERFVEIVRQLRSENGCPWDKAQTHKSLRRCLVEETGEFLDAIENNDLQKCRKNSGLLLQVLACANRCEEGNSRWKMSLGPNAKSCCGGIRMYLPARRLLLLRKP